MLDRIMCVSPVEISEDVMYKLSQDEQQQRKHYRFQTNRGPRRESVAIERESLDDGQIIAVKTVQKS